MTNQEIYNKITRIFGPTKWGCPKCFQCYGLYIDLAINYDTFDDFFNAKITCKQCRAIDFVTRFWILGYTLKTTLLIEIEKWFRVIEPELTMPVDVDRKLDSKRDDIFRNIFR